MASKQIRIGMAGYCRVLAVVTYLSVVMLVVSSLGCRRDTTESATASTNSNAATKASAQDAVPGRPTKADVEVPVVRIETTAGTITVRLDGVRAPGTVRNFLNYVNDKFYDKTIVHFVDAGRTILAGGFTTNHQPKPSGTPIRNEAHNGLKNTRGTIAMTRDPSLIDSATTQFFINLIDAPQRNHTGDSADKYGYCVFGEVIEGLDIAEKISQASTKDLGGDLAQTPDPPVVIESVRLAR